MFLEPSGQRMRVRLKELVFSCPHPTSFSVRF